MSRLDATSTVAAHRDTHAVELDGEVVLLHPADHTLHRLNASATLVWSRLDGVAPLDAIATEIAEAAGVPVEVVLSDVVDVVRAMADAGLVVVRLSDGEPPTGSSS